MSLIIKKIKGKGYFYSQLSYFVINKSKSFSKYVGLKKPSKENLEKIEENLKNEIIVKLSKKKYSEGILSKDDIIKTLLYRSAFNKKFASLSPTKKKKYEIDRTILFTLTTLTTEDVDVSLKDVKEALKKQVNLSMREKISKNMLNGVASIKKHEKLTKKYLLDLHKQIMSEFETKTPGKLRDKQVYLHKRDPKNPLSVEIAYRPPQYNKINELLDEFIIWYDKSNLNPIEKASLAHYKLYSIHPFLDGNKRICRLIFNKCLIDDDFPIINVSEEREYYFEALIKAVENNKSNELVNFVLKEYFRQVKIFVEN
jgi:Fic family protein